MTPRWPSQIEPEAAIEPANLTRPERIALSQAISLRRIADALTVPEGAASAPLYNLVTDLMWQAGQAFERGKGAS